MTGKTPAYFNIHRGNALTANVLPLLHEIRHALEKLLHSGEATVIDLRSIPLAPGEDEAILDTLGAGEVQARMDALGPSEIYETRYAGVWVVTHYNESEEMIGRFIEVTEIPAVLKAQREDVDQALQGLAERLEQEN
ncbi:MAG: hydrogenase expression/formation C-terminal domain-containing protein [Lysobacterales bacterium]|jgi:hydrogenase-1 operon protein HyaF